MKAPSLTPLEDATRANHAARTPSSDPMKARISKLTNAFSLEVARMMDAGLPEQHLIAFTQSVAASMIHSTSENLVANGRVPPGATTLDVVDAFLRNVRTIIREEDPYFHDVAKDEGPKAGVA